jgi:hypothetical protein
MTAVPKIASAIANKKRFDLLIYDSPILKSRLGLNPSNELIGYAPAIEG